MKMLSTRAITFAAIAMVLTGLFVVVGIQAQSASDSPDAGNAPTNVAETFHGPHTNAGAVDLSFEPGGVFNGPSLVVCDVSSTEVGCASTGKTHVAGKVGGTYWMPPHSA